MQQVTDMLNETFDGLKDEIGAPERVVITLHANLDALYETLTEYQSTGLDADQTQGFVMGLVQTLNWILEKSDEIPTLTDRIN